MGDHLARRPRAGRAPVRDELSLQLGETFELDGETLHAFPQPEHLLRTRRPIRRA